MIFNFRNEFLHFIKHFTNDIFIKFNKCIIIPLRPSIEYFIDHFTIFRFDQSLLNEIQIKPSNKLGMFDVSNWFANPRANNE